MPTALVALLLFAATVDPRLDEPLRLLAEVSDTQGEPVGVAYAEMPQTHDLILIVSSLPPRAGAHYHPSRRVVTVAAALLDEDPRVVATGLVHEFQHVTDFDEVANGVLEHDCVELEARAFEAQARVTRAFWPNELPAATEWERGVAASAATYEAGGLDGLRAMVRRHTGYQDACHLTG
jgi:hypothetical protein